VADNKEEKFQLVSLAGIGNIFEHLVAEDAISCDERDRIIQKILRDDNLVEHTLSVFAGYGLSKNEVLERTARKKSTMTRHHKPNESYVSLTDIVRAHSDDALGYVMGTRKGVAVSYSPEQIAI